MSFDFGREALVLHRFDGRAVAMPELFHGEPRENVAAFLSWFNALAASHAGVASAEVVSPA